MTTTDNLDRAVADPIGLITDLVADVEKELGSETIRAVVTAVAGGRAKSRRLAEALAMRPAVLTDGRSPAPRAIGDLLIELRKAGASAIAPPVCAECGKKLRTLQRQGQDWYCSVCGQETTECTACGNIRRVGFRDRKGLPRCKMCPDYDDRDPVTVVHELITAITPDTDRNVIAEALRRTAPHRPTYRQRLVWALEENPRLLTGEGYLAPHRAILRFVDLLHEAGVAGIVRPACPRCHRVVRIDKPLDGQRVCTATASPSPASKNAYAAVPGASRLSVTHGDGRCVRTAWSPTPRTSRSASAATDVDEYRTAPLKAPSAPPVVPCRSWSARSADAPHLAPTPV
ncbi:hypothetical protein [Streptomyces inhibens]|uniref:hypothetical protein n=1 Tax=Streptomyces inhibens TaxID=2293571 RepID=UPI001C6DE6F0|nr:hypothetical protein [Streptomyces inhibens]